MEDGRWKFESSRHGSPYQPRRTGVPPVSISPEPVTEQCNFVTPSAPLQRKLTGGQKQAGGLSY